MINLLVVGFSTLGVGYEKKTVLHCFREMVLEFVFRALKLVCERWEWGSALWLKSQPWWVTILGL